MTNENGMLSHDDVLEQIVQEIELPLSVYETVELRYRSMGSWLEREESGLSGLAPYVAPQGSILLGTAIRPVSSEGGYDIDLICRLNIEKTDVTQEDLKALVGNEIKSYAKAQHFAASPEDKRRCWTLRYSDNVSFHMDILPCIPNAEHYRNGLISRGHTDLADDEQLSDAAIAITDRTDPNYGRVTDDWPTSNPLGYANWFMRQMAESLAKQKRSLAKQRGGNARGEDIPDYEVKTTLQKVIQLLKVHRDSVFEHSNEQKPISIIITTLAALAYDNEATISEALGAILKKMEHHVDEVDGVKWVANPVNPDENFADKWTEESEKEKAFYFWLGAAQRDFGEYLNACGPSDIPGSLRERLRVGETHPVVGIIESSKASLSAGVAQANVNRAQAMVNRVRETGSQSAPWIEIRSDD